MNSMATEGTIVTYLLTLGAIFLMNICVAESQPELNFSDVVFTQYEINPPTNILLQEYIVVVEMNVSQVILIEQIKSSLNSISFLVQTDSATEISLNVTTVCVVNETGYSCRCEDQYVWPRDKCVQYGHCDNIMNATCQCLSDIPNDGLFCQAITELTNECTDILGVCGPNANCTKAIESYSCTCLSGYSVLNPHIPVNNKNPCRDIDECTEFPNVCGPNANCTNSIGSYSCTCLSGYNITNPGSISCKEYRTTLSLTIGELFDNILTNPNSKKYKNYSNDIKSSIDNAYQSALFSYKAGSMKITRFRPGSTVADFTIVATSNTLNFSAANKELASALIAKGYNVTENSVAQTEENGLCDPDNSIYPGENMVLTCTPPDSRIVKINWNVNGNNIETSIKYQISSDRKTLTVTNTSDEDSGQYACIMTFDSIPYIIWQRVVIQPFPDVQASSSKTLNCEGLPVTLECCAHNGYTTQWSLDTPTGPLNLTEPSRGCSPYTYTNISVEACKDSDQIVTFLCEAQDIKGSLHNRTQVRVHATAKRYDCYDEQFGAGNVNGIQTRVCDPDSIGSVTARCQFNTPDKGVWEIVDNTCVLRVLQELVERAENLQIADVAQFTLDLWKVTDFNSARIRESEVNVLTVVTLLKSIANISQTFIVDQSIMMNFLRTSDVISSVTTRKTWERLNAGNTTRNTSSELLKSIEDIGTRLTDDSFNITTHFTHLIRTRANGSFFGIFGIDSTTQIEIPEFGEAFITTIVFSALDNVLPVRNTTYNESTTKANINGDVATVLVNNTVHNISLTFEIKNKSFESPQCVFWNFSLLDGIGGWDSTGCELKTLNQTDKITCVCNHTTSFSLLMSPFPTDYGVLRIITFIGVGISIFCLISALIIESIIWKSVTKNDTSYMRHVSIVNITLSLLIADICFIIGAAIVKRKKAPVGPCNAATFFMHFFYLALFFWMLFSALLLLYRTIIVFSKASKSVMKVIAFAVGYGAPLLIAIITVAITIVGGGYIQEENACWLNWFKTKALLAFVIPALTIVGINFLVLIVVLYKMLRRGVGAANQPDDRYALVVIVRCVAILTPIFGLTWAFGIGTMVSPALGIHIVFALLNSLQGFFVLLFGILLDKKVRATLAGKLKH